MRACAGISLSPILIALLCAGLNAGTADPRVPPEVRFKSGYVNPVRKPADFTSAMLWGIAIADVRVPGSENAQVEIAQTQFACVIDGRDIVLNDDHGNVRGGLYRRYPWFGTDAHDPMPLAYSPLDGAVVFHVGSRPDKVWHFWAASPRKKIPTGALQGCTVRVRAKISAGALLQVGFDYWRNTSVGYAGGGNNHEAGASRWYFPSPDWQEAVFTDTAGNKR